MSQKSNSKTCAGTSNVYNSILLPPLNKEVKKHREEDKKKFRLEDFELHRLLGQGAFGMVYLAKHIETGKLCALKQIDKAIVNRQGKSEHVRVEKLILTTCKSPYLLKAVACFQDKQFAWLGLEYCPGGDLREFLSIIGNFEEQEAVLFFAEMILGVHDLHTMGFLHRDIKPDNFLIDKNGHIKLADFGLAKPNYRVGKMKGSDITDSDDSGEAKITQTLSSAELASRWKLKTKYERATLTPSNFNSLFKTNKNLDSRRSKRPPYRPVPEKNDLKRDFGHSIVGSPEYMSPEVAGGRYEGGSLYSYEVDWWSLGCVFFEMIVGYLPFQGDSPEELFKEIDLWIEKLPIIFEDTKDYLSPECHSLLMGFLCDRNNRLGPDIHKIKAHPFFKDLNWNNLTSIPSPFVPLAQGEISYF